MQKNIGKSSMDNRENNSEQQARISNNVFNPLICTEQDWMDRNCSDIIIYRLDEYLAGVKEKNDEH